MTIPNLVIAGAPKSGTTSLFKWLQAHPSVVTQKRKETYYLVDPDYFQFNKKSNYITDGLDGYSKLFPEYQSGQICIDATPDNMYQQTALKVLRDLPTQPLVIFILRNPVERLMSMFGFAKYNLGLVDVDLTERDFIDGIKNGRFSGIQILQNAILYSEYALWLEKWIQVVGESRVEIIFFDDIVYDPKGVMSKICNRIGIDDAFYNGYKFNPENPSIPVRSGSLVKIKKTFGKIFPTFSQSRMPQLIYKTINIKSNTRKPKFDLQLQNELYEYFAEPNRKLASILGRELPTTWSNLRFSKSATKLEGGLRLKGVKKETKPDRPLISIITASFNSSLLLHRTMKSIRELTYDNIEWIVIDGLSTDNTLDILKKNEHAIDYWLSEPDTGIYDAWNKGIMLASGEWIAFLGFGDAYKPDAFSIYTEAIRATDILPDLVSSRVQLVDTNGFVFRVRGEKFNWENYKLYMDFSHVGALHHKGLFEKYGLFDTGYKSAADYEFFFRGGSEIVTLYLNVITTEMLIGGISSRYKSIYEAYVIQNKYGAGFSAKTRFLIACAKRFVRPLLRGY